MKVKILTPVLVLMIMFFYGLAQAASADDVGCEPGGHPRFLPRLLHEEALKASLIDRLGEENAKPYLLHANQVSRWIKDYGQMTAETIVEALAKIKVENLKGSLDKLEPLLKNNPIDYAEFSNLVNALDIIGDRWETVQDKVANLMRTLSVNEKFDCGIAQLRLQVLICSDKNWQDIMSRSKDVFDLPALKGEAKTCLDIARVVAVCDLNFHHWQQCLERATPFLGNVDSGWQAAMTIAELGALSPEAWGKAQSQLSQAQGINGDDLFRMVEEIYEQSLRMVGTLYKQSRRMFSTEWLRKSREEVYEWALRNFERF